MMTSLNRCVCYLIAAGTIAGCGDDDAATGSGQLTVLVESEDTITEGLDPGNEAESIQDGWQVRFDQYIVAIGDIRIRLSTDTSVSAEAADVFAVDLTRISSAGLPLWELSDLAAGDWEFNYRTPGAAIATPHPSVDQADFDEMVEGDHTYLIAGAISKADGQSCPPTALAMPPAGVTPTGMSSGGDACYASPTTGFRLLVPTPTTFGPCEVDGLTGFSVAARGTTAVAATIHGDHPFFNGFPEGAEGGILRLAQWLADCDLDLDGFVTRAELEAIAPADLPELDERYQLGGSPVTPLVTMWDYLIGQLKTQGHFQGEGECPFAN